MGLINTLKKLKEKLYLEKCYYFDYPKLSTQFNFSVLTNDETIEKILAEKPSVSRFGDGELALMEMQNIGFQKADEGLAKRLREIIGLQEERLLVCITDIMIRNKGYVRPTLRYHAAYVINHFERLKQNIPEGRTYGCTNFTRFYADYANKDRKIMQPKIDRIMSIWGGGYCVYLIEGEYTRSGIGNDLYKNAVSVHRIICPATDAYEKYDEILQTACSLIPHQDDVVVLCLLGPTATVLAYDLHKAGYWALDMGHIDIEYEWFLRGTAWKASVPGKAVNERGGNHPDKPISSPEYEEQIIAKVL